MNYRFAFCMSELVMLCSTTFTMELDRYPLHTHSFNEFIMENDVIEKIRATALAQPWYRWGRNKTHEEATVAIKKYLQYLDSQSIRATYPEKFSETAASPLDDSESFLDAHETILSSLTSLQRAAERTRGKKQLYLEQVTPREIVAYISGIAGLSVALFNGTLIAIDAYNHEKEDDYWKDSADYASIACLSVCSLYAIVYGRSKIGSHKAFAQSQELERLIALQHIEIARRHRETVKKIISSGRKQKRKK